MAEYGSMTLVSGLAAILFFGGWNGPIPIFHLAGWADGSAGEGWRFVALLFGMVNFLFKCVLGVVAMMWLRWSLPRLRIDQVLTTCLKYCIPIAAVCFVGATLWDLFGVPFVNDLAPHPYGERANVRERWSEADRVAVSQAPSPLPSRLSVPACADRMTAASPEGASE
jgi:NADH-quinone oxidoreductase subunit H